MKTVKLNAVVRYTDKNVCFHADIFEIGKTYVIASFGPVNCTSVEYTKEWLDRATHHLIGWPGNGYWKPSKGIFVVPRSQLKELQSEVS